MKFHTIKSIKTLDNLILLVSFESGECKKYDFKPLIKKFKNFEQLKDNVLFNKARIDVGGYGIVWNENIEISSEELWKNGIMIEQ